MSEDLQKELYSYVKANEQNVQIQSRKLITAESLYNIFEEKFEDQYGDETIFSQDFFKVNLKNIANMIMNVVFRDKPPFMKIDHIVAFTSILQHILYQPILGLPKVIQTKLQKYLQGQLVMQNLETMRTIFDDGQNSTIISDFYLKIYKEVFSLRIKMVLNQYGLKIENCQLPFYLLQAIIEQKEGNLEVYSSKTTAEWIILSLIYFILAVKSDIYKQKPILQKILSKYRILKYQCWQVRDINGDQLCHFYNNVILKLILKIEAKEIERQVDHFKTDIEVSSTFVVTPIESDNNTILDNVIFSSSWQP